MTVARNEQKSSLAFVREFKAITGLEASFDEGYLQALDKLVAYLATKSIRPAEHRRRLFLAHVNWKFRLNAEPLGRFYREAAGNGYTFHYHQKCAVQRAFDLRDRSILVAVLKERGVPSMLQQQLLSYFDPIDEKTTLEHLKAECREPSKLRKEKGNRDIEREIIQAHFSAFMWGSLPEREMHRFFDPLFSEEGYRRSFWEQLHLRHPFLFSRDNALHIIRLDRQTLQTIAGVEDLRRGMSLLLAGSYEALNNYGVLAIAIEPGLVTGRSVEWKVVADAMLYGEKHREGPLHKAYFRWERVRDETCKYVGCLDTDQARFELANEGFTYRDCFVVADAARQITRLLVVFQKNERDETPIPCPTCRTLNVQGNSYPSLGVRSWECNNLLCPDRSKYNRGKRYSFRGLLTQQAIEDERNEIPADNVRQWTRDVVANATYGDIAEMLIRHYSLYGDGIRVQNWPALGRTKLGRKLNHQPLTFPAGLVPFWNGPFFARYVCDSPKRAVAARNLGDEAFQVLLGDSGEVLRSLSTGSFHGAVTSPPYYNARDYAKWPNMYCYLHDMFDINREVYRTLKPGAVYLYNVFDYFDNENTVVFSAMGQKRMILSAYTVDLFRRIGFELVGNVVWDKGDIEGKRGFNAGNFSPYYQSPFNCWEHVLVFRKPGAAEEPWMSGVAEQIAGQVVRQSPVIKMVRGENVHGHSAPFPEAIPELLVARMPKGSIVLDPFAGSLTTGRVAEGFGVRSVCIERSREYCRLGLKMRDDAKSEQATRRAQLALFDE